MSGVSGDHYGAPRGRGRGRARSEPSPTIPGGSYAMAAGGSIDKSLAKASKMADILFSEIGTMIKKTRGWNAEILCCRDRARNFLNVYHNNLINILTKHEGYFKLLFQELYVKREAEIRQICEGANQRWLQAETLIFKIESFKTDPTKTLEHLNEIFDQMKNLKRENDDVVTDDGVWQNLLKMEFDYHQEQTDFIKNFFDPPSSLIFLKYCVMPNELKIDLHDGHTFNKKGSIFVKFPPSMLGASNKFCIPNGPLKMEATNLNTNVTELLPFQEMIASLATIGFEFNLTECCQYRIKCTLYDIPIRNSPITVKVIQNGTTEVMEIMEKVNFRSSIEYTVPPAAFANENNAAGAYTPRKRPDLTNLIKPGRGIAAKLVLEMGVCGKTGPAETYFSKPIGCTFNEHTGCFIICDTEHNAVKVYDRQGCPQVMIDSNEHTDGKLCRPSAVCVVENDRFIVKDNQKLYKFEADGQLFGISDDGGQFKHLFGMAQDNRGVILTVELMNTRAGKCPTLCGIDGITGKILFRNEFAATKGVPNSKCYFMDCYDDTLVVLDLGLHKVYVCDATGRLKLTFGEREMFNGETGKFNEPSGVTIDAAKNIFVGDARNHRVQIWTHLGEYLGDVAFSSPIYRPSDIHLTADGHMMVMNCSKHFVAVYKLEVLP